MQNEIVEILDKADVKNISTLKEKWDVGRVVELFYKSNQTELYGQAFYKFVAKHLGISTRQLFRCRQFFKAFQSSNWKEALQIIPTGFVWHNFLNYHLTGPAIEESLKIRIVKELEGDGWNVEREKQTPVGRIDIFASTRISSKIIEVKGSSRLRSIREAFGQLMFYQEYYPKASIFIALPRLPSETMRKILDKYRIGII